MMIAAPGAGLERGGGVPESSPVSVLQWWRRKRGDFPETQFFQLRCTTALGTLDTVLFCFVMDSDVSRSEGACFPDHCLFRTAGALNRVTPQLQRNFITVLLAVPLRDCRIGSMLDFKIRCDVVNQLFAC